VSCRWLEGGAIERRHWEFFDRCYRDTYAAHRSTPYLSLDFSCGWAQRCPPTRRWLIAERAGRPIASALFLADRTTLYGRYWGATEHLPLLHFECCYYQAIEYAIAPVCRSFEAAHRASTKLFRGLLPVEAFSAHGSRIQNSRAPWRASSSAKPPGPRAMWTSYATISPFKDLPGG